MPVTVGLEADDLVHRIVLPGNDDVAVGIGDRDGTVEAVAVGDLVEFIDRPGRQRRGDRVGIRVVRRWTYSLPFWV